VNTKGEEIYTGRKIDSRGRRKIYRHVERRKTEKKKGENLNLQKKPSQPPPSETKKKPPPPLALGKQTGEPSPFKTKNQRAQESPHFSPSHTPSGSSHFPPFISCSSTLPANKRQAAALPLRGGTKTREPHGCLSQDRTSSPRQPSPDFPLLVIRTVTAPSIFGVSSLFLLLKSAKAAALHQIILLLPGRRSLRRKKQPKLSLLLSPKASQSRSSLNCCLLASPSSSSNGPPPLLADRPSPLPFEQLASNPPLWPVIFAFEAAPFALTKQAKQPLPPPLATNKEN